MSNPEEVTTQRFYLRKIEGAEILLAFETNFFRQELHKWAPVAPDPPPILQHSLSTRKPRPTKQQKLMSQLGIESVEDLPQAFRTKQHTFSKSRKSSDSLSTRTHQPLQPAPFPKRSDTPNSNPLSNSGNAPDSLSNSYRPSVSVPAEPTFPFFSAVSPRSAHNGTTFDAPSPTFGWQNRLPSNNSPSITHSPIFRPSTPVAGTAPPLEPGLFSPETTSFAAAALRETSAAASPGLVSPNRSGYGHERTISAGTMDNLFADFTTTDADDIGRNEAGEALEGLGIAGHSSQDNDETRVKLADDFLN
jgi:histone demethylase JARID1